MPSGQLVLVPSGRAGGWRESQLPEVQGTPQSPLAGPGLGAVWAGTALPAPCPPWRPRLLLGSFCQAWLANAPGLGGRRGHPGGWKEGSDALSRGGEQDQP